MDTDQILDLFSVGSGDAGKEKKSQGKVSAKRIIEEMDDLWDESQYETLQVDDFLQNLK